MPAPSYSWLEIIPPSRWATDILTRHQNLCFRSPCTRLLSDEGHLSLALCFLMAQGTSTHETTPRLGLLLDTPRPAHIPFAFYTSESCSPQIQKLHSKLKRLWGICDISPFIAQPCCCNSAAPLVPTSCLATSNSRCPVQACSIRTWHIHIEFPCKMRHTIGTLVSNLHTTCAATCC